jgi:hypothetical protein
MLWFASVIYQNTVDYLSSTLDYTVKKLSKYFENELRFENSLKRWEI